MKFMISLKLRPDRKKQVLEAFELRGPNRNPGVTFGAGWIGTRSDVIFVVAESSDESLIAKAAQSWIDDGEYEIHPIVEAEQY